MASEIRINTLKNRSGLSTVSLTDSGPIFTGIATFTEGVGIAGTLTYEDVTNIDSIGIITARSTVSIADSIVHTWDTNTSLRFPAADTITAETGGLERLRITSTGTLQVQGDGNAYLQLERYQNNTGSSRVRFVKSRSDTVGTNAIVQDGDQLGAIDFYGSDGNSGTRGAASISAEVDGTPGSADMPGRLVFKTVPDGSTTFTERMRISSAGHVTKPFNPMFKVNLASSPAQNSSGWKKIPFSVDTGFYFNIGGHYDTTNYKFTAPVDGFYQFGLNQRIDGGNGNYFRVAFWINGSDQSVNNYPGGMSIYRDNDGFNYVSLTISCLIKLDANDYVEPYAYSNTDTAWTLQDESQFYGYLVG